MISYSGSLQDVAAAKILNKVNGSFLDIGCAHPIASNNTYLLETEYNFHGVSIDQHNWSNDWNNQRFGSIFLCQDALTVNYAELLQQTHIDYLSIDIDPGEQSLDVLKKLLQLNTRFSFITFEFEQPYSKVYYESRECLKNQGYELFFDNVSYEYNGKLDAFEDWYIDPSYIEESIIAKYKCVNNQTKNPKDYYE